MTTDGDLRRIFRAHLAAPQWEWTAVESRTVSGIPDAYWSHVDGASGWLEVKQTSGWAVDVRPHQVGWLTRHAARGARCAVGVRATGQGSTAKHGDALWLVAGRAAGALAAGGLQGAQAAGGVLGVWYGAPRDWDWSTVARLLLAG